MNKQTRSTNYNEKALWVQHTSTEDYSWLSMANNSKQECQPLPKATPGQHLVNSGQLVHRVSRTQNHVTLTFDLDIQ